MATVTSPSRVMGGGYQNCGTMAPLGVGHQWLACSGADVAGFHITTDGVTWLPANDGIFFGRHRVCSIEGSRTVANRLYGFCAENADGTGANSGIVLRGTFDPATGLVAWTQIATTAGAAGGGAARPRQTGRLLVLDEANDTLYVGTIDGVWRVTISTGVSTQRALAGSFVGGLVLNPADPTIGYVAVTATGTLPGVHRVTNLRTGTVASTRHTAVIDPRDLVFVNALVPGAGGSISQVGTIAGNTTTGATSYTPNTWPTVQTGDLIVIYASVSVASPPAVTATAPDSDAYGVGVDVTAGNLRTVKLWRFAESNGEAAPTINHAATTAGSCSGVVLRGVDATTPFDTADTTVGTLGSATTATLPSITTTSAGCWLLAGYGARSAATPAPVLTPGSGHTEQVERSTSGTGQQTTVATSTRTANPVAAGTYGGESFSHDIVGGTRQILIHTAVRASTGGGGGDVPISYLYVAGMTQGPRRWTVGADITTGWTDLSSGYNLGANGCAYIDAFPVGTAVRLVCGNAGEASATNAGAWSDDGGATWSNEASSWTVSYVPAGETVQWWLPALTTRSMLDEQTFDCSSVRFDPANPLRAYLWGRAGIWRTLNGGSTWEPTVRGLCVTVAHTVAADPLVGTRAVVGDGDWTSHFSAEGFATGPTNAEEPQTGGLGLGVMFRADTGKFALAIEAGEVWTTVNPFAAAPTWVDNGFSTVSTAVRRGVAIGQDGSAVEVLLTVRSGTGIERKLGAATPTIVSTLDTGSGTMNPHFVWPQGHLGRAFVYCSMASGLLRSVDHGASWTRALTWTNNSEYTGTIHPDPVDPDTLYVTRDDGTPEGTGLFKVTAASTSPVATLIGPVVTQPGPCAVDPTTGVVYLATRGSDTSGTSLWASPSNNPDASTTFADVTDPQWAAGPFEPSDMCVLGSGQLLVSNKQGGYFVATRTGAGVIAATATLLETFTLIATAEIVGVVPVVNATGALTQTMTLAGAATIPSAPAPPVVEPWFNGVWWPKLHVLLGLGGTLDPGPQYLHLGVGPGLGTGMLGGAGFVDLQNDIRSISIRGRGRDGPVDSAAPATCTIVLNNSSGDYDPDNPSSPLAGLDIGVPVGVRAERPMGTIWQRFYGEVTSISLDAGFDPTVTLHCADGLEKLGRAQLAHVEIPVGDGDRSGGRVNRILDLAGYPSSLRSVDLGYTIVAPTSLGDFALELLRRVEMTEFGLLFVDGAGKVCFYDRHQAATASRSTTVQATFADSGDPDEPAMVSLELDWSRDRTFNDVHITRDPTDQIPPLTTEDPSPDEPVEQVHTDPVTSDPAVWGTLSLPAQVGQLLRSDPEAKAMARYLVDRFNRSQARIRQVRVNALTRDLWDVLLALGPLDRVRVIRDYGPRVITSELLIEGMAEEIGSDPPTWEIVFDLANPPPAPTLWRLGTSALGSGRLGW